jgi:WD repeat-containing protein 45
VHALCQFNSETILAAPHINQGSVAITHYVDCVL